MENRKPIKLLLISGLTMLLLPVLVSAYAEHTTHPALTDETVDFFNYSCPALTLTAEEKELVKSGSKDEDAGSRFLNHFYDPVRNIGINNGRTAKDWALAPDTGNEFSWQKALEHYAQGDEEKALLALGHIVHLLEDMTVPDHTRNDPHIGAGPQGMFTGESPYETWADETQNRNTLAGLAQSLNTEGAQPRLF